MHLNSIIKKSLAVLFCLAAVVTAVVETCSAWTVFSILFGAELAAILCVAIFHFAASDAILVFESTASEIGRALYLLSRQRGLFFCFWLLLYALAAYVGFCIFMPFSYMQQGFQTSIFLYVYCVKYHHLVPVLTHFLIMPASLSAMLNALSKVWSLIRTAADYVSAEAKSTQQQQAYETVVQALAVLVCVMLTLTLSESAYISMQYGVSHYKMMHAVSFGLTRVQESLLLTMITLSTFRTMTAVTTLLSKALLSPLSSAAQFAQGFNERSRHTCLCQLWGYFTVFVRAAGRGVQTASVVNIAREMTLAVADKARSNAAAALLVRQPVMYSGSKFEEKDDKEHSSLPSPLHVIANQLINFRCL